MNEKWRTRIGEAVIGGSTSLLMTVLYIFSRDMGVGPGEWLQFAGVFLGVIATIGGTQFIQGRQERLLQRDRIARAVDSLILVEALVQQIIDDPGQDPVNYTVGLEAASHELAFAVGAMDQRPAKMHVAGEGLRAKWNRDAPVFHAAARDVLNNPVASNKERLSGNCREIKVFTDIIRAEMETAGHATSPENSPSAPTSSVAGRS